VECLIDLINTNNGGNTRWITKTNQNKFYLD
jgi:hypothetical protein